MPLGSSVLVNIARPGQRAVLTFDGVAGHGVSHWVPGTIGGQFVVVRPDNSVIVSTGLSSNLFIEPYVMVTGTYRIIIDPSAANTGTATLANYDVPDDVTGSIPYGGSTGVSLSTPGQNALLGFTVPTARNVRFTGSGNSFGCVTLVITKPGGGTIAEVPCASNFSFTYSLPAGDHTLKINPSGATTGSMSIGVGDPPP